MNIKNHFKGNAIKLYVFVDSLHDLSEHPFLVIISRYKKVYDLRQEFVDSHKIPFDDQHWIINNYCYPDETEINEAITDAVVVRNGYVLYLCVVRREEVNRIHQFIDTYLEEKYRNVDPVGRFKDPIGNPIVIADSMDTKKPLPVIGWICTMCTMSNKAYKEWCEVCGASQPDGYEIPRNYIWTEEDTRYLQQLDEDKKRQQKIEEECQKKLETEREEYRKKLELMYKDKVSFTTEDSECPICIMEYKPGESVILHSCLHTVCKDCLKAYLSTVIDPKVKCPTENCVGIVEDGEISGILTEEEYAKYEQLSLRTAESKTDNTFHCKTPNCTAWVVYDDNVNFFDCPLCKKQNCLLCQAIHEGQTCKEYQDELVIKARNDEAARKDLAFLEDMIKKGEAMKCSHCKILIQRKSGCDWMKCNMCKTELCWATKGPRWGPKGPGDTSGGCKCRVNNIKCSPKCGTCH